MLVEVREAMFVCAWAKEVKRSLIGNVRVACDVGWGSRGNVCLCVSKRGEEKFLGECSCGMWCWLRFARQCLFVREQKRWREVLWGNVRVACDVGWGSRGNVCLCVSKRGEEKFGIGNVRVACDVGWGSRGNVCLCVCKRGVLAGSCLCDDNRVSSA